MIKSFCLYVTSMSKSVVQTSNCDNVYLLRESSSEEGNEVFGVNLDKALEMRFDKVDFIFFFRHLIQMLRVYCVTLHQTHRYQQCVFARDNHA